MKPSVSPMRVGLGLFVVTLLLVLSSMVVLADTQFPYVASLVGPSSPGGDITHVVILPNVTLLPNTSFYLRTSHASTTANAIVLFYYNDSTTAQLNYSTSSLTNILITASNPYPGKIVDQLWWSTFRSGTTNGESYLTTIDFWELAPVANFSLQLTNIVNGSNISGFCAILSVGSNLTCTVGNGTPIIDPSGRGWNSENRSQNYNMLLNAQAASGNVTRVATVSGLSSAVDPWYTQSNFCTTAYFNTGCGISGPSNNYYCLVTDELSQRCLSVSMSQNSSSEVEAGYCHNTIVLLNASAGGYGNLTEWTSPYDNRTGTPLIPKNYTNDNAGDSDARFTLAELNTYNNPSFSDSTLKANALARATSMCRNFITYDYATTNKISNSNTSRNITHYPAGGGNVASAGITGSSFMYSGYYGDYAIALLGCYVATGDSTYLQYANDTVENLLAASNWTTSSGFKVPPGRSFHWTSGAQPSAKCDVICNPDYIDDPDGKRLAKVCGAERLYRDAGLVLHPNIAQYCSDWYALITPITYAKEWYTNGTRKSNLVDDYDANALGTYLDMSQNSSNIGKRLNLTGNKFVTGTNTFDSATCQGLYNPSFPIEVQGYLTSPASLITLGASGANSCNGGAANPVTYTEAGLSLVLTSPINNSNLTSPYSLISFSVYNNNATVNITAGTLPQILYNTTFASDPTVVGWTLGSWSYNSGAALMNNSVESGGSMHTQNLTFAQLTNGYRMVLTQQCPPNSTNAKFYYGTDSASDSGDRILLCDRNGPGGLGVVNLKHDGGAFSSISCSQALCNVTITVNLSANTINVSNGTASWQDTIANSHGNGSTASFVPGQDMTGGWNITDFNATNIGNAYNISSGGNSSLNVTIYTSAGAKLYQTNYTTNGSAITYNWTGLSGTNSWQVNVWTQNNREDFGNFTFNIVNASVNYTYCTTGDTISHSVTGVYNLTVFNITSGNTAPVYLNVSRLNYNFSTNGGNYYTTVVLNTSQALLNLMTYRLFLNSSISTFNVTNNQITNQTTNGSMLLPANNGTNNLQADIGGNYSMNATCLVSTVLSTVSCNVTGIYDTILTVRAKIGSTFLNNVSANATNSTLGGLLYNRTSTNGTISLPLLQGYYYFLKGTSTGYSTENTSLLLNTPSYPYNFSLFITNTINLTIKDEITNTVVQENFTMEAISDSNSQNFTIVNGTANVTFNTPELYILRYYSTNYAQREYHFNVTPGSYSSLTIYAIRLNQSDVLTATVTDTSGRQIENATIKLMRYFVDCNCYPIVEMKLTSSNGQALFNIQPSDGHYKWAVDYAGRNYFLSTTSEQIITDTRNFIINLGSSYYTDTNTANNIGKTITYDRSTGVLVYTYSDPSNTIPGSCIELQSLQGVTYQNYETSCSTGSSGSIIVVLTDPNTTTYKYKASINMTSDPLRLYSIAADIIRPDNAFDFGSFGIFLAILIIILLAILFSFHPAAMMLSCAVGVIFVNMIGLMPMEWSFVTGFVAMVVGLVGWVMRQ